MQIFTGIEKHAPKFNTGIGTIGNIMYYAIGT